MKKFFSGEQLAALSQKIDPEKDSGLQYYPLPRTGERFPVCDPSKLPVLEPRPKDDSQFLHGAIRSLQPQRGMLHGEWGMTLSSNKYRTIKDVVLCLYMISIPTEPLKASTQKVKEVQVPLFVFRPCTKE